jgi:hypothetical protein
VPYQREILDLQSFKVDKEVIQDSVRHYQQKMGHD